MRSLLDVNLNSLRIVEAAARTGSFVRAAEEQLLTPSAISQRIKNLEEQLQFKIFNRGSNSVSLTTEGDAFVANVREALDKILQAGQHAKAVDREHMLKICALPTFIVRWLMPRLTDFKTAHKHLSLHLSNSYTPPNFNKQDFDCAILYGNGDFGNLKAKLLFEEDLTPVCNPAVLVGRRKSKIEAAQLSEFTLLHSETCTMNWEFWLKQENAVQVLKNAQSAYFDSCMLSYEAATAGLGFAIANCAYMLDDIKAGRLIAPLKSHLKTGNGWYIVYPDQHASIKLKLFEAWLVHVAIACRDDWHIAFKQ